MNIVMIKHKSHLVAADPGNALAKSSYQIRHSGKQHIGQDRAFEMSPESFNHIKSRTIWRQPERPNVVTMGFEPLPHRFGLMKPPVVADQPNLSASIGSYQNDQEGKKVLSTFGLGQRVGDLAHPLRAWVPGNRARHRLPAFRFCLGQGSLAADPPATTSASMGDVGGSPSRLGRPEPPWHRLSSLFFQANKVFFGLAVCFFVPFVLEGMFGSMDGKAFLV